MKHQRTRTDSMTRTGNVGRSAQLAALFLSITAATAADQVPPTRVGSGPAGDFSIGRPTLNHGASRARRADGDRSHPVPVEQQNLAGGLSSGLEGLTLSAKTDSGPIQDPIPEPIPLGDVEVQLTPLAGGLTAPNWATHSPVDPTRLYVCDQPGRIFAVDLLTGARSVFLDLSDRLVTLGVSGPGSFDERGLLGFAFHPGYADNGLLYTYTSEPADQAADFSTIPPGETANHQSVVTEWRVANPVSPDSPPDGPRVLVRIDQPQVNHNAGALEFDPDGRLYVALGDGGGPDDQSSGHGATGNGQDPSNPLGAILRIDPLGGNSANGSYGIPQDNPFAGEADKVGEIYAYGFRNPFRMSLDPESGDLWAADVGQANIEEIDLVTAGGNYGWNYKEGSFFFQPNGDAPGYVTTTDPGVPEGLIDPVAEYDHDEGTAIIGGFVYRGKRIPELHGRYVFGDLGQFGGNVSRLRYLDGNGEIREFRISGSENLGVTLLGFGRDADGELYVLGNSTATPFGETGVVLRLDPPPATILASVLPGSRSVAVGGQATAFASLANTAPHTAVNCGIEPGSGFDSPDLSFSYQATDPLTNAVTGAPDTPVDIAAGAVQSFVFAFSPKAPLPATEVSLDFHCDNAPAAPVVSGLNTFILSASETGTADIVALATTPSSDGILDLAEKAVSGVFAVASINLGTAAVIDATPLSGNPALPLELAICETDPQSGACLAPPQAAVTAMIAPGATPTFGVFVTAQGTVPFDPAENRIFVRFTEHDGAVRGSTSVAVRTL